jgi:spoIIIJ-associated protein
MAKIIETTGKTVDDALNAALENLGVAAENVEYEILEKPSKGFLGFGAKPAKILVKLKENSVEIKTEIPVETETEVTETVATSAAQVEENIAEKIEPVLEETKTEPAEVETKTENLPAEEIKPAFDKAAVIAAAKNFLSDVFAVMNIEVEIKVTEKDSEVILSLVGKNLGSLIGKHGQTLDALQYLTNLTSNVHDSEEKVYFVLDVENYRQRRATALTKLAKSVADRVIRTRQDVKLEPMSRSERKVIHTALQNNQKVETHSAGEDPYRYIIVSLKTKSKA